jgi:hypothetical protein
LVIELPKGRHDMGMMEWCAEREFEGMGMMGGGIMDGPPLFLFLPILFFVWLLGLAVVAGVGVWAVRRFREQNSSL